MNSHLWLIHGDLHLNNITIAKVQQIDEKQYVGLVLLDDKVYELPYNTNQGCIIDFSRCILGDTELLRNKYSERYVDIYSREQTLRLVSLLHVHFPEFMESNLNKIQALAISNFALLFKISTLVDIFMVVKNMEFMYTIDKDILKEIGAWNASAWLSDIANYAEITLLKLLTSALDGSLNKPDDIEWPVKTLLMKYFTEFEVSSDRMDKLTSADASDDIPTIIDVINYNLHAKYSTQRYETWPELLKPDIYLDTWKRYGFDPPDPIDNLPLYKYMGRNIELQELARHPKAEEYYEDPWMFI